VKRSWSAVIGTIALLCAALVCAPTALAATTSGNLILDGDANAGSCTSDWTAATTVPGWTVVSGSPDLVCSSIGSFGYPRAPPRTRRSTRRETRATAPSSRP
jgi:hypothetical protein